MNDINQENQDPNGLNDYEVPEAMTDKYSELLNEIAAKSRMIIDKNDPIVALLVANYFMIDDLRNSIRQINEDHANYVRSEIKKISDEASKIMLRLGDDNLRVQIEAIMASHDRQATLIQNLQNDNQTTREYNRQSLIRATRMGSIITGSAFFCAAVIFYLVVYYKH